MDLWDFWVSVIRSGFSYSCFNLKPWWGAGQLHIFVILLWPADYQGYAVFMAVIGSYQRCKRPRSELAHHHFSLYYVVPSRSMANSIVEQIKYMPPLGGQGRGWRPERWSKNQIHHIGLLHFPWHRSLDNYRCPCTFIEASLFSDHFGVF